MFKPFDSEWRLNGNELQNGPDFGMNTFYVKLVLGGVGWSRTTTVEIRSVDSYPGNP